jgi:hypothetical protein
MSSREEQIAISAPALCLPDDRSEWAAWLERQLVGLNLPKLCKQLITLGGTHPPQLTVEEVLGVQRAMVMQFGLQDQVSVQQLQQLLSQPALLLDLQAIILEEGSDYWIRVQPEPSISASVDSVRKKVMSSITASPERNRPIDQAITDAPGGSWEGGKQVQVRRADDWGGDRTGSWYWLGALLATAAAILVVVMNLGNPQAEGEFFAAAELRTRLSGENVGAYLNRVADRIQNDWKNKKDLKSGLIAFRDSCKWLNTDSLDQALEGLTEPEMKGLKSRCAGWETKLTKLIEGLEEKADGVEIEADKLVAKMVSNEIDESGNAKGILRNRAKLPMEAQKLSASLTQPHSPFLKTHWVPTTSTTISAYGFPIA